MGMGQHGFDAFVAHAAPGGRGRRHPHADEGEEGFGEDGGGHGEGQGHQNDAQGVGNHVPQHQIGSAGAQQAGGADVALLADLQNLPAHQPCRGRPAQQHQRQHQRRDAGLPRLHPGDHPDEDHEQQEGQGDHEVGEAHQRLVDPAAEEAGGGAVGHAEGDEDQGRNQAYEQGDARPRHQPRQHVPAQVVGA